MTDFTTSQGFQFYVTAVPCTPFNARTRQNVQKRIESTLYLESPPDSAIKLAYVGSKELSPVNNLYIGDKSDSLYANSRVGKVQEFSSSVQPAYVKNTNFVITQEFNTTDADIIPLYYKMVLPTTVVPESVRIYDKDFNTVSADKYKLEAQKQYNEDTGVPETDGGGNYIYTEYHLYNDLESFYDYSTNEFEVYFIQYTDSSGSTDVVYTKLLENELAYKPATFEDIWYVNLRLKPWVKAYSTDSSSLIVYLPKHGEYSVRYEEKKRVKVIEPVSYGDTSPWFPRVINGSFVTGYASRQYKYSIPEFENQAFNPYQPYKLAANVLCLKVTDNLLKLPHEDIQQGSLFSYTYIVAKLDGAVQYAITDDPDKAGTYYRDFGNQLVTDPNSTTGEHLTWSSTLLLGVDTLAGIVHVGFDIKDSYDVTATYSYKESYYEVTGLNMNPIFDSTARSELRVIYLVPEAQPNNNVSAQTTAIHWLKIAQSGLITVTSQGNTGGNEDINSDIALEDSYGYKLSGVIGMHYNWTATTTSTAYQEITTGQQLAVVTAELFPRSGWIRFKDSEGVIRYAKFTDKTDTTIILSINSNEIAANSGSDLYINDDTTIELVNFVDERTTLTSRTSTYELAHIPSVANFIPVCFSRYFVLADMCINPPHSHKELAIIDVREDGGGVKEDKYDEAKLINPQVQWLADFHDHDGQPYPGKAVIVVKLPAYILEQFTGDQLERIIGENVPFGVKPLVRYYWYEPNIISVLPDEDNTSIDVTWDKMGDEFTYSVFYAKNKNGPWIKHHDFRLTDDVIDMIRGGVAPSGSAPYQIYDTNVYTVDGLDSDTVYYIRVACKDRYHQWWYSYSGPTSIGGGQSELYAHPSPDGGNNIGFQLRITLEGYGFGYGPFGSGEFGGS